MANSSDGESLTHWFGEIAFDKTIAAVRQVWDYSKHSDVPPVPQMREMGGVNYAEVYGGSESIYFGPNGEAPLFSDEWIKANLAERLRESAFKKELPMIFDTYAEARTFAIGQEGGYNIWLTAEYQFAVYLNDKTNNDDVASDRFLLLTTTTTTVEVETMWPPTDA